MTVAYGAVGTKGSVSTKTFPTEDKAAKEAQKKLMEKTKKGYQSVERKKAAVAAKEEEGKKRPSKENKKEDGSEPKKAKKEETAAAAAFAATQEETPSVIFSDFMEVSLRGGGTRWWSIYQDGCEVTEASGDGDPKEEGNNNTTRERMAGRQFHPTTNKYKTVAKAVTEAQKLHKRKLKQGFVSVEGKAAIQPKRKIVPETYSAFLTCATDAGGKFWSVEQKKEKLHILYGPIGAEGTLAEKVYDSIAKAHEQATKMAEDKQRNGYVLINNKKAPNPSLQEPDTLQIKSLEEALALPIRIEGYLRDVDDYTADYVVKFILERRQKTEGGGDWCFALLHQQCCVHDRQFRRTTPRETDVLVPSLEEDHAKAVFEALVDILKNRPRPIRLKGRVAPPEGTDRSEMWDNIELTVTCEDQILLTLFQKLVPNKTDSVQGLEEKPKALLDSFLKVVGLTAQPTSVFEPGYKGKEVAEEDRWDMKSMPLYL